MVRVGDARVRERGLQAPRVRPRVFVAAYAAPLTYVDEQRDVRFVECVEEAIERPSVDADGRDGLHGYPSTVELIITGRLSLPSSA